MDEKNQSAQNRNRPGQASPSSGENVGGHEASGANPNAGPTPSDIVTAISSCSAAIAAMPTAVQARVLRAVAAAFGIPLTEPQRSAPAQNPNRQPSNQGRNR